MSISSLRSSFWLKVAIGLLLVAAVDALFFMHRPGATLGFFALVWLGAAALFRKGWVRDRRGLAAAGAAAALALVMIDRPGFLAWVLFGLALTIAEQSVRVRDGEEAWRWAQRLVVYTVLAVAGPWIDLIRLNRNNRKQGRTLKLSGAVRLLLLPVVGGAVFLGLFASANPLIGELLSRLRLPPLTGDTVARVTFWLATLIAIWGVLRPRWRRRLIALPSRQGRAIPDGAAASVILSLVVFKLHNANELGRRGYINWAVLDVLGAHAVV